MVTEWWNPDSDDATVARTYRDGSRIIVEIDVSGVDPSTVELEVGSNRLHLTCGEHESMIPLPLVVNEQTAQAQWQRGLLQVVLSAPGSPWDPHGELR